LIKGTIGLKVDRSSETTQVEKDGKVYWNYYADSTSLGRVLLKSPEKVKTTFVVATGFLFKNGTFKALEVKPATKDALKYSNSFFLQGKVRGVYPFRRTFRLFVENGTEYWKADVGWINVDVGSEVLIQGLLYKLGKEYVLKALFWEVLIESSLLEDSLDS